MKEFLLSLFGLDKNPNADTSPDGWTQAEREALIALLLLATQADQYVSISERAILHGETGKLAWDSPTELGLFIDTTTATVRGVEDPPAYLSSLAARFSGQESRSRAYDLCKDLFEADGSFEVQEIELLQQIQAAFGLAS